HRDFGKGSEQSQEDEIEGRHGEIDDGRKSRQGRSASAAVSADGERQSVENRQDRYPRLRDWGNNFSDRPVPRFKQGLEADKSRFSLQKYQKPDREEG